MFDRLSLSLSHRKWRSLPPSVVQEGMLQWGLSNAWQPETEETGREKRGRGGKTQAHSTRGASRLPVIQLGFCMVVISCKARRGPA